MRGTATTITGLTSAKAFIKIVWSIYVQCADGIGIYLRLILSVEVSNKQSFVGGDIPFLCHGIYLQTLDLLGSEYILHLAGTEILTVEVDHSVGGSSEIEDVLLLLASAHGIESIVDDTLTPCVLLIMHDYRRR